MPRSCPPEFRRKVLDLVESGRKVAEVAQLLGISEQTIYMWRRQRLIHPADARRDAPFSSREKMTHRARRHQIPRTNLRQVLTHRQESQQAGLPQVSGDPEAEQLPEEFSKVVLEWVASALQSAA
ncbi:transposase [Streptomyces sp. SAI-144]|uniref:transposase n=1 Tax=Streptomyces sp. SAI-144 TaxID=2940544 RepID=UPI0024743A20|nr:transposase [Streptomyces sp. SAI-144]MDH6437008.1 transposase [Streptomyces sp. SAI-144]